MTDLVELPSSAEETPFLAPLASLLDILLLVSDGDLDPLVSRLEVEPAVVMHTLRHCAFDEWPTCRWAAEQWMERTESLLRWPDGSRCDVHASTDFAVRCRRNVTVAANCRKLGAAGYSAEQAYLAGLVSAAQSFMSRTTQTAAECWQLPAALTELVSDCLAIQVDGDTVEESVSHLSQSLQRLARFAARKRKLESSFDETLQREKLLAMSGLAYGASHEINNPLANISTRAQTLLRDETDPERRRKLSTINSQAFRAHEMISDMMLFAKPPRLKPQSCDVGVVVTQVIAEVRETAEEQGTVLNFLPLDEEHVIQADPVQLAVAFKALVTNSLEALVTGGEITIEVDWALGEGTHSLLVSIRDTGPGIPDEIRNHLFDPFFSGREAGRGLGLGLSKCWRIVTDHGGSIIVESNSQGSRFDLVLPASTVVDD